MTKRLDKTRDYGSFHPADQGAHFEQDGFLFDHEGYLVVGHPNQKKLPAKSAEKEYRSATEKAADKEKKQADSIQPPASEGEVADDKALNLEMWLRGEADYDFAEVQKAVKARFSKWCTQKEALVTFLVIEADGPQVVPAKEVRDEFKPFVV